MNIKDLEFGNLLMRNIRSIERVIDHIKADKLNQLPATDMSTAVKLLGVLDVNLENLEKLIEKLEYQFEIL